MVEKIHLPYIKWLNGINHGRVFCVNKVTFHFVVALEYEFHAHICKWQVLLNDQGNLVSELQSNDEVFFYWDYDYTNLR